MQRLSFTVDVESPRLPGGLEDIDSNQTVIFLFSPASAVASRDLMAILREKMPNSHIVASSSYVAIAGDTVCDKRASCMIVKFEKSKVKSISSRVTSISSETTLAETIYRELYSSDLKGVFILADNDIVNLSRLTHCLQAHFHGAQVSVTGGAASWKHRGNGWVFDGERCERGAVVAVGFYGRDFVFADGISSGWSAHGPILEVTKSSGTEVYEIDGSPALEVYRGLVGVTEDEELKLKTFSCPIALVSGIGFSSRLIRTVQALRFTDNALVFSGDVPEGAKIQLVKTTNEELLSGAERASAAVASAAFRDAVAIVMSCVGRYLFLGPYVRDELVKVRFMLPRLTTDIVGMYSFGEIAPSVDSNCALHNQTLAVTLLSEW